MTKYKTPRGKCRRCGKRKHTPGAVLYNGGKSIQGLCGKCLRKIMGDMWEWEWEEKM